MAKENDTCMRAGSNRATVDYRCAAWSDESLTIAAVTPGLRGNGAKVAENASTNIVGGR